MSGSKGRGEQSVNFLKEKIKNRTAVVAVMGLGYVGLPMAVEQAKTGFSVIGIDKNNIKVEQINSGKSYIRDVPEDILHSLVESRKLSAHHLFDRVMEVDIIIICVPTPLKTMRQPDLSFVIAAAREVAEQIKPGQLIIHDSQHGS